MLSLTVNVEGALRKIDTAALAAEDLHKPLAIFGGRLKKRAVGRWQAQDFPPLADATVKKRAERGLQKLGQKLEADLKKATGRAQRERAPKGLLAAIIGAPGMTSAVTQETRGEKNRRAVLQEFQRLHVKRVSGQMKGNGFQRVMGGQALTLKQQVSLAGRAQRAIAREVGKPVLGQWPRTYHVMIEGHRLTLVAATHEHWTQVHNEGGAAGKGAKEPPRPTIVLDKYDLDVFVDILREHCLHPLVQET